MNTKEIDDRFTYHKTDGEQQTRMDDIRVRAAELAHAINTLVADGREKSTAITKLEEVMFWANAGISRNATSHQAL